MPIEKKYLTEDNIHLFIDGCASLTEDGPIGNIEKNDLYGNVVVRYSNGRYPEAIHSGDTVYIYHANGIEKFYVSNIKDDSLLAPV